MTISNLLIISQLRCFLTFDVFWRFLKKKKKSNLLLQLITISNLKFTVRTRTTKFWLIKLNKEFDFSYITATKLITHILYT